MRPLKDIGRDLLFCLAAMATFAALFILLSLAIHGKVNW